jgi:hypothetical protein
MERGEYVKSTVVFVEFHLQSVKPVDYHGCLGCRIHGDSADLADFGQREDVCNRLRVEPNFAEVWEIANEL